MNDKIVISVAPIQAGTPVDADMLASDMYKCIQAGASMCHLHCRRPDGSLTPDISYMSECFDKIRAKADVVVQVSTGGVSEMDIVQRCEPLKYPKAETASLNAGSTNLGEAVYINSFDDIRYCAREVYAHGIIPDVEVFDIGMINNVEMTAAELPFRRPIFYNLVFGHKGGMQPNMESLIAFRSMVPRDAKWGVTHYGRDNWRFLAAAIAMGAATVRIGFEDSAYLSPDENAVYNYQLVERLVEMVKAMGIEPATVAEAREIMGCLPK